MRHDNGRAHGHYKPGSDPRLLLIKKKATQQRNRPKERPRKGKPGKA